MSENWESHIRGLDSVSDFDMKIGNDLAESLNSVLSDYIAGDICGFELLVKVTKAVDTAQDAVSNFYD